MFHIINQIPENPLYSDIGKLQFSVVDENGLPIPDATVSISQSSSPDVTIEELKTDSSGLTPSIELKAPPVDLSLDESNLIQPYSLYNIITSSQGRETTNVSDIQILSTTESLQTIPMANLARPVINPEYTIPPHTLYGDFPPKIAEDEIKPIEESGEIVLRRVVIPEYIIVHDGPPSDTSAGNYTVPYTDYIKNVASSEIYATWPESTIYANVLAILSFTLNRVFTEWYRGKGYPFTITSSTAFDQKWVRNRNIFTEISQAVDDIFTNYLSRPDVLQPIFTQYCDGKRVTCPNWLSQWGSKALGDQGYRAIEILRNYYGDSIYINEANQVSGIPSSFPGYNLTIGSSGDAVLQIQEQLNRIRQDYPSIPRVDEDGIYGENTKQAVEAFQRIFKLPVDGIVGRRTWYKISQIYVGVTKIAEHA